VIDPLAESDVIERRLGTFPPPCPGYFTEHQGEFDIFQRRARREKVEDLEDDADDGAAEMSQFPGLERIKRVSHDLEGAAGRGVEPAQQVQQGGLAGTTRPHDTDKFPLTNLEVDSVHGPDGVRAPEEMTLQFRTADRRNQVTASRLARARCPATARFRKGKSIGLGM